MHRRLTALSLAAVVALTGAGCASRTQKPEEGDAKQVVQEAPLGSRIRKKSNVSPVSGATRDDIERQRIQQGAIETGVHQN